MHFTFHCLFTAYCTELYVRCLSLPLTSSHCLSLSFRCPYTVPLSRCIGGGAGRLGDRDHGHPRHGPAQPAQRVAHSADSAGEWPEREPLFWPLFCGQFSLSGLSLRFRGHCSAKGWCLLVRCCSPLVLSLPFNFAVFPPPFLVPRARKGCWGTRNEKQCISHER